MANFCSSLMNKLESFTSVTARQAQNQDRRVADQRCRAGRSPDTTHSRITRYSRTGRIKLWLLWRPAEGIEYLIKIYKPNNGISTVQAQRPLESRSVERIIAGSRS
jgi:hypothetical protein